MNIFHRSIRSGVAGLFVVALMLFAPTAFSSDIMRVEGAPVISTKAEAAVFWRSAPNIGNATTVTFMPLPALALKALQEENASEIGADSARVFRAQPLKIGVNRSAATELAGSELPILNWQNVGDGHTARWAVTSPDARGMRVALQLHALPDSAEMRFSGSAAPERIIGVISGKEANALRDDNKVYWTPVTEGETQNIEIYLPSTVKTGDVKIRLNGVSHLFTSAQDGFNTSSLLKLSGFCQVDVACKFAELGTAFQNTSKAVAKMVTTDAIFSYFCTGTLLNNANGSQTPYFWSVSHCLNSNTFAPAQQMANTLNTHWFYEAAACGSLEQSPNYSQLSGGARILHNQASTDTLLLQLNNAPPAGAFFAAWDATPFSSGPFTAIHHPRGDTKKVSIGNGEGRTADTFFIGSNLPGLNLSTLPLVSWTEGIIEQGSSGSGLFTLSNGNYYLRGGASIASTVLSCFSPGEPVNTGNAAAYASLSLVYDSIKQYLGDSSNPNPPPAFGPSRNYSGQWIRNGVNEMGWGLSVIMGFHNQRYIFVPWYTYDSNGNAQWFLFQGDVWAANDVFSGDVMRYKGSPWHTMPWNNNSFSGTKVGTAKLTFTSTTKAKFEYNVEGSSRTIDLTKIE